LELFFTISPKRKNKITIVTKDKNIPKNNIRLNCEFLIGFKDSSMFFKKKAAKETTIGEIIKKLSRDIKKNGF